MEQVISQDDSSNILSPDIQFTMKCYKLLRKLGYIKSQYDFSEQFLAKIQLLVIK